MSGILYCEMLWRTMEDFIGLPSHSLAILINIAKLCQGKTCETKDSETLTSKGTRRLSHHVTVLHLGLQLAASGVFNDATVPRPFQIEPVPPYPA